MTYTGIENTPIVVDLLKVVNDTGWSVSGDIATHVACNNGSIQLEGYTIVSGHEYTISYEIISISAGGLQLHVGDTLGAVRTTPGTYIETITATGTDPVLLFNANANCQVRAFNIKDSFTDVSNLQQNTIAYSPVINKWTSFYTMAPDYGFSMYIRTLVFQYGVLYSQQNGSTSRNAFFGKSYDSLFKFIENKNTTVIQTYEALSIQSNQLMITSNDGVQTSLGQLSTLIDTDFEQQVLTDGGLRVDIYDRYGVYMASFVNDDNGDELKGNYLIVQLQSTDSTNPLQLFALEVKSSVQHIGAR